MTAKAKTAFQVKAVAFPDMLRSPPPQFAHLRLLYSLISVQVAGQDFPVNVWCDFSGVLLLRWNREIRNLIERNARYARLIFTGTPCEVWLRRTNSPYWKASCVTWDGQERSIALETLCVPEYVEASLDSATRQLLASAREAGVWYEDCQALADFLNCPSVA